MLKMPLNSNQPVSRCKYRVLKSWNCKVVRENRNQFVQAQKGKDIE